MTTAPTPVRRVRRRHRGSHRSRWARAWSLLTTLVLGLVALFALLAIVFPLVLQAQTYTVLTGSMRPGLPPGTLVGVRETPIDDIRIGDVVTYQLRPGEPDVVTHRVVGTTLDNAGDRLLLTQGDNNNVRDEAPVQPVQVRGVVVYAVPFIGYPGALIGGATRSLFVVAVGIAIIGWGVLMLVVDLVRTMRRRRLGSLAAALAVLALAGMSWAHPAPARADVLEPVPPAGALSVSADGTTWGSGADVALFDAIGALAPGEPVPDTLWVRNDSHDAARVTMVFSWDAASSDPADGGLADDLRVQTDDATLGDGETWHGPALRPGESRRIDLALVLSAQAGNDTRRADAVVHTAVRLTEVVDAGGGQADRGLVLPVTGGVLAPIVIAGGVLALVVGARLLVAGRRE